MGVRLALFFLCLFFVGVNASLTLHIQHPFRSDSDKASYSLHILGGAAYSYNPDFSETSKTMMTSEGNDWYYFVWDKNVSDFQNWMNFNVKACPNTSDNNYNNNNCVSWTDADGNALAFLVTDLFGSDTEIWLYTDGSSYKKDYSAPGSKVVWFKSPWGNKAVPKMIFGSDSVLMRFAYDDPKFCGWFYGAISPTTLAANPAKNVYFERLHTSYMTFPQSGTLDIAEALNLADTIFIDGSTGTIDVKIGTLGECFDSTRTLHVYSPWRSNSTYKDSLLYIAVGSNILNNPAAMDSTGEFRYWFRYDFSSELARKSEWSSTGAVVQFYRRQNEWPAVVFFDDASRPMVSSFFPQGVYEAWVFTKNGQMEVSFSPLEPKFIRLMSPWDNMAPAVLIGNDTLSMGPFSADTCGWYEAAYYKHMTSYEVLFRQRFGFEYYTNAGLSDGDVISLDSVLAISDTVWVTPYPTLASAPRISREFPGRLGVCPSLKISAMLVDWAGEAFADSIDIDFGGTYDGSIYTEATYLDSTGAIATNRKCQGLVKGMVRDTLVNGNPARVDSLEYPWDKCAAAHEIEKWFVPVNVATDAGGNVYTNATCRDIDLSLDAEGFWLADISESHEDGGFFPLDNFEYLDSSKTVKNPKFDWSERLSTNNGKHHNYSFAMKISAQFQYVKGQYFEFRGDDDVWVYINNKLVVDIGGVHSPVEDAVDLDTLGLVEGETYPFRIFFSERNATGSNFKMRTSINLETEKTYYPVEIPTADGTISYEIWQMIADKSLSCDISSVTKIDTVPAASMFVLKGGNLSADGVVLGPGLNYGGINVTETMAGFTIDTSAIVRSRTLAPGNYILYFYLESDQTQSSRVSFVVPEYPLPNLVFADSLWNPIDPDTVALGSWAFVPYPVYVMAYYMGAPCDTGCDGTLEFLTSDSLSFTDANGNIIDSIVPVNGHAAFNVLGSAEVANGSFGVFGKAFADTAYWKHINLEKPPVPIPSGGKIFDRDGDGVADRLVLAYEEKIVDDNTPDTVAWAFGDTIPYKLTRDGVEKYRTLDSLIVLEKDSLIPYIFTGSSEKKSYVGSYSSWFNKVLEDSLTGETYTQLFTVTGKIHDKIGPVLTNAIVKPENENIYRLSLVFSEAIDTNSFSLDSIFEFRAWRDGSEFSHGIFPVSGKKDVNRYEILYSNKNGVLPSVGDSVRIVPGFLQDMSGNFAHENNRWVRIVGEQVIRIESAKLFDQDAEKAKAFEDSSAIVPHRIVSGQTYQKAEKAIGLPGFLIQYDLGELVVSSGADKEKIYLKYEADFFTNLGTFVSSAKGTVRCTDELFGGDCTVNSGNIYLGWNMRSKSGRLVGTGAYVALLKIKIGVLGGESQKKDVTRTWGIRRVK